MEQVLVKLTMFLAASAAVLRSVVDLGKLWKEHLRSQKRRSSECGGQENTTEEEENFQ